MSAKVSQVAEVGGGHLQKGSEVGNLLLPEVA